MLLFISNCVWGKKIDPEKGFLSYKSSFDVMVLAQKMQVARIVHPTDYMTVVRKKKSISSYY